MKKPTKQQAKRTRDENAKAMQAKQLEKLNAAYERATGRGH
jgi:hypothetical protein